MLAGVRQRSATFTPQKLPKAAQINSPWELNHWNCWRSLGDSNPCFRRERAKFSLILPTALAPAPLSTARLACASLCASREVGWAASRGTESGARRRSASAGSGLIDQPTSGGGVHSGGEKSARSCVGFVLLAQFGVPRCLPSRCYGTSGLSNALDPSVFEYAAPDLLVRKCGER